MWIVLNNAFVSIVEHRANPDTLIVRGRFAGDVERFFHWKVGDRRVVRTPSADYLFRATVHRSEVAEALHQAVRRVHYPNFKDSIRQAWRKALAMRVWSIFHGEQAQRSGPPKPALKQPPARVYVGDDGGLW